MNIPQVVIVLCNPNEGKNIGAVCRAMFTMGLSRLRIVGHRADYDDEDIRTLSVHAFHLWEQAEFFDNLTDAVADCVFAAGTTRRGGHKRSFSTASPRELASRVLSLYSESRAAIVFGNERTGLTEDELNICSFSVSIPAVEKAGSLNLSHAVQIIAYELYLAFQSTVHIASQTVFSAGVSVSLSRIDKTVDKIILNLKEIGFFSLGKPEYMKRFWRSVFSRAALSEEEALYIEKIFDKTSCLHLKHKPDI